MEDVKMPNPNLFDTDWVKRECLENIKLLEEEIEFLKAQSILTQYTIDTCGKDYPSYILEAMQTIHNSIEKRIKKFEQVLTDEETKYALLTSERSE